MEPEEPAGSRKGRIWVGLGALAVGLGVAAGAFGAHALKSKLEPEMLQIFEVAARYQVYHGLALMLVGGLPVLASSPRVRTLAGLSFLAGILIFSGSLYLLTLTGERWWGRVTPFGGGGFLLGWTLLSVNFLVRVPDPTRK